MYILSSLQLKKKIAQKKLGSAQLVCSEDSAQHESSCNLQ